MNSSSSSSSLLTWHMPLFARKKSTTNVSSAAGSTRAPAMPAIAPNYGYNSPSSRLELSPEVSTPLYERFARVKDASEDTNRMSLGLFDGSSMGVNGRAAASRTFDQQLSPPVLARDPVDHTPPSAFRGLASPTVSSPTRKRSTEFSTSSGPPASSSSGSAALMQEDVSRERERLAINAALERRASQSLDMPRMSAATAQLPSRSTPSPNSGDQQYAKQKLRVQTSRSALPDLSRRVSTSISTQDHEISSTHSPLPRPPSSSGHRISYATPTPPNNTAIPPSHSTPVRKPSVDMSFYPTAVQQVYNNPPIMPSSSPSPIHAQPLPIHQQQQEQQQQQHAGAARIPQGSRTNGPVSHHTPISSASTVPRTREYDSITPTNQSMPARSPSPAKHRHHKSSSRSAAGKSHHTNVHPSLIVFADL